ncbi:unnamed protein product [Moneuplotes crassus]|uniref:Uncharacterized protein n=1 Tax=Euplotes crassus TaxID=5936 RepID=A0AAD1XHP0_EUPCR|nr:unnamed protein product [Moneuplotes crassus]
MKHLIIFVVIIALACSTMQDKLSGDLSKHRAYKESPLELAMKGKLTPEIKENLSTFLQLAKTYVPALQEIKDAKATLSRTIDWEFNILGFGFAFELYIELIVGWRVAMTDDLAHNLWNLTYDPFVTGYLNTSVHGDIPFARGTYYTELQYADAHSPISVDIYDTNVCFGIDYHIFPIDMATRMNISLQECSDEILNELLNNGRIGLTCNRLPTLDFDHLQFRFTEYQGGNIGQDICFDHPF